MLRALLVIITVAAVSLIYSCNYPEPVGSAGPGDTPPSKNSCMENCIEQDEIGCKKFDPVLEGLCDSYLQK